MLTGPALLAQPPHQTSARCIRPEARLLIVAGDIAARRSLHVNFYRLGFDIAEAGGEEDAIALCRIAHYDAVLFAAGSAGSRLIQTCARLRRLLPRAAIVILGADADIEYKVRALEAGVDEYVTRPYDVRELTARIRSALRRASAPPPPDEEAIVVGEVSLDPARRLVRKAGSRVHMTPKEFSLLHYLISHAGLPITHARLLHCVWRDEYANVDILRTFVRQLRKKLEDNATSPHYILTVSHIGYQFVDPADWLERRTSVHRRVLSGIASVP